MKLKSLLFYVLSIFSNSYAQNFSIIPIFKDQVSIRAIVLDKDKIYYAGTEGKFGYVSLKDQKDQKQIQLGTTKLEFRTLTQTHNFFYLVNIESPAYFYQINKKNLEPKIVFEDHHPNVFYDAFKFTDKEYGLAFSDPAANQKLYITQTRNAGERWVTCNDCADFPILEKGEAAFAASNSNIASAGNWIWIATGGTKARIFRMKNKSCNWEVYDTPMVQGSSSQGIYTVDFYDKNYGIIAGGDYTKPLENINNIATTEDGGKTWQLQASGANAGYITSVKFRPKSKGKDILAVGDQHISFSVDYGKTWKKISDEKDLYTIEWVDSNTAILAGKNKIMKLRIEA